MRHAAIQKHILRHATIQKHILRHARLFKIVPNEALFQQTWFLRQPLFGEFQRRLYGYDPSATLNDAATLNDTTRNDATHNDATHDDLATPTTTTRPTLNVNADWKA